MTSTPLVSVGQRPGGISTFRLGTFPITGRIGLRTACKLENTCPPLSDIGTSANWLIGLLLGTPLQHAQSFEINRLDNYPPVPTNGMLSYVLTRTGIVRNAIRIRFESLGILPRTMVMPRIDVKRTADCTRNALGQSTRSGQVWGHTPE